MRHISAAFTALAFMIAWPILIAEAASPPIEAFGHLPAIQFVTLSPSGERVAYVTVNGDRRIILVRTLDGRELGTKDIGDWKIRGLHWAGDDHVIILASVLDNVHGRGISYDFESERALVLNTQTGDVLTVFRHSDDLVPEIRGFYGTRHFDDRWYGYFGADPLKGKPSIYRVDLDDGVYKVVATGSSLAIDAQGKVVAHAEYRPNNLAWTLYAGTQTDDALLKVNTLKGGEPLQGLGRRPGTILVARYDQPGATLWEMPMDPAGPPVGMTVPPGADILHDDDGLAIGFIDENNPDSMQFFDPAIGKKIETATQALAPAKIKTVSWSRNFDRIMVKAVGPNDPGSYFSVDIRTGKADLVGRDYPNIGPGQIGASRMVSYKAADGLALEGVLTTPPGPEVKNRPLVVLPHGGPAARDYPGFNWWAQAFASRGYAVFQPNFRGSSGYGAAFLKAGNGEWGRKMQTDISDGVAELARQGIADAKRVCIVGASFGGYSALAGVTLQHGLYRCAVSVGGVTDLPDLLSWILARQSFSATIGLSEQMGDVATMKAWSPVLQAAAADAPILLIYGRDDTVVPPRQSQNMAKALTEAGKPVETVVLGREDHWLSREATRVQMLKAGIAFVESHNPPN